MYYKNLFCKQRVNRKSFFLFLLSFAAISAGDSFNFIVSTSLLISITGSGLSAGFNIICTPVSSIIFSPFAGIIGDRYNEKYLLIFLDFSRAFITFLFALYTNVYIIYLLILIRTSIEVIAVPARKKFLANILNANELVIGNSLLSGLSGLIFIISPILAAYIISLWKYKIVFFIICLMYMVSALIIVFIRQEKIIRTKIYTFRNQSSFRNIHTDIWASLDYYKKNLAIKRLIKTSTIIFLCIASINVSFYPFSFDILKVTNEGWGIMMSIFYGSNLLAMFLALYINKSFKKIRMTLLNVMLFFLALIWYSYSLANTFNTVIIFQFIEGVLIGLFTIFFNTKLQVIVRKDFTARIIALNDFINNIGKLISIILTYLFVKYFNSLNLVFIINSFIILIFLLITKIDSSFI